MKRTNILLLIAVLALFALTLSACGKSEFGETENTGKRITITAINVSKGALITSGSLEVADGDRIVITSNLTKGLIRVEIVESSEEQSIDILPDLNSEAVMTADVSGTETVSETVPTGSYMLRVSCLEKANGTIEIVAQPAA